jgi:hypothetical protein
MLTNIRDINAWVINTLKQLDKFTKVLSPKEEEPSFDNADADIGEQSDGAPTPAHHTTTHNIIEARTKKKEIKKPLTRRACRVHHTSCDIYT